MKNLFLLLTLFFCFKVVGKTFITDELKLGTTKADPLYIYSGDGGYLKKEKSGSWSFSNDGNIEKAIGSGSGNGGGENYNNAFVDGQNPNAEDGKTGWTASAGVFAVTTTDPLEGSSSFTWTPAAQNDTLDSAVLDFDKDKFRGRSCLASIEYIGGDTSLGLQVIDADGDVIGQFRDDNGNNELPVHNISGAETAFFLCPNSAATANDKDIRLRLINLGASASAEIKFDKAYVGTNYGLSESSIPDVLSGVVLGTDGSYLEGPVGITSSRSSTGTYSLDYSALGLTATPSIHIEMLGAGTNWQCSTSSNSATSAGIECHNNSNVKVDKSFNFTIVKQGADAKQSVQVYKSIPKVSDNINSFSARYDSSGSLVTRNTSSTWATCAPGGTGNYVCTFVGSIFTETPSCRAESFTGSHTEISALSASSVTIQTRNAANALANSAFFLACDKQGDDFKMPTVQPVVVGQVANSYAESSSKNVRVESCYITNSGTPATSSDLCDTWIDSISDLGTGNNYININSSIFSSNPVCTANVSNDSHSVRVNVAGSDAVGILSYTVNTNTLIDAPFNLICVGEK